MFANLFNLFDRTFRKALPEGGQWACKIQKKTCTCPHHPSGENFAEEAVVQMTAMMEQLLHFDVQVPVARHWAQDLGGLRIDSDKWLFSLKLKSWMESGWHFWVRHLLVVKSQGSVTVGI